MTSSFDALTRDLIERHIERMNQEFSDQPYFTCTEPVLEKLLQHDVLKFTQATIAKNFRKSLLDKQHYWDRRTIEDLFLVVSTVPDRLLEEARMYFKGGYLSFLDEQVRDTEFELGEVNIVNWIFCSDGEESAIHLTLLPFATRGFAILAQDLFTEQQWSLVGAWFKALGAR